MLEKSRQNKVKFKLSELSFDSKEGISATTNSQTILTKRLLR